MLPVIRWRTLSVWKLIMYNSHNLFSPAVMKDPAKRHLRDKVFFWLTIPGYDPSF